MKKLVLTLSLFVCLTASVKADGQMDTPSITGQMDTPSISIVASGFLNSVLIVLTIG